MTSSTWNVEVSIAAKIIWVGITRGQGEFVTNHFILPSFGQDSTIQIRLWMIKVMSVEHIVIKMYVYQTILEKSYGQCDTYVSPLITLFLWYKLQKHIRFHEIVWNIFTILIWQKYKTLGGLYNQQEKNDKVSK